MVLGDSKSYLHAWSPALMSALTGKTGHPVTEQNGAIPGTSIATMIALIDGALAALPNDGSGVNYQYVLLNWGVNDGTPVDATWEANYLTIIDKVHVKAPNAKVYIMRPWKVGMDTQAAVFHTDIDTIVAARVFTYVGPDEAIFLKGSDNGLSETVADGIHPSMLGEALYKSNWQTVLGY